jgi:hypothetical protein
VQTRAYGRLKTHLIFFYLAAFHVIMDCRDCGYRP